ncbi:MAG: helix-turn-helix domain-containing protein [Bryobacteraceae bacterium]
MARRKTRALEPRNDKAISLHLATSRQKKGSSLEQIADLTKISIRFLRAIEDEEFEKLPGGIFSTSYLRQYAAAVEVEEAKLLAHYDRLMNPPVTVETAAVTPERSLIDRWLRVTPHAPRP